MNWKQRRWIMAAPLWIGSNGTVKLEHGAYEILWIYTGKMQVYSSVHVKQSRWSMSDKAKHVRKTCVFINNVSVWFVKLCLALPLESPKVQICEDVFDWTSWLGGPLWFRFPRQLRIFYQLLAMCQDAKNMGMVGKLSVLETRTVSSLTRKTHVYKFAGGKEPRACPEPSQNMQLAVEERIQNGFGWIGFHKELGPVPAGSHVWVIRDRKFGPRFRAHQKWHFWHAISKLGTVKQTEHNYRDNSTQVATCWVYRGGLPGILTCGVGWGGVCQRWCSCVHMVRCWCVDVYTWYVGWGGVGCVNVGVHVYTWYAAGVLMCTHGTLLVCWCVHMVRYWCVHVYTWCAAGVLMCTHGTWGGVGCVNVGVHVYTWYAAGVLMCTHGTLLVCWCVHMVRCWCVDVYTWYAAGVFMCTHGTLLVCSCVHMVRCWCVMCKRITQSQCHVWLSIVSSSWLGSMYFFLPCVSFLSDSFCLLLVYVIYIYV